MENGYIFILQYVKNLEDQVLADNFPVGKELIKSRKTFYDLVHKLYINALAQSRLVKELEDSLLVLPEQKHNVEWMTSHGNQNEEKLYG